MDSARSTQGSVAESFLRALKRRGLDNVFANSGTDFAPLIEGLVSLKAAGEETPNFMTVPHENLAMAMAHGYHRVSGKLVAVMVHTTVGTANAICGLMNAQRDQVPLILMAGRTPITQAGSTASRSAPIHWGQENFDQSGMVREYTKWDYELRAGQSPDEVVGRAIDIALSEPRGPVYLTLPREVLASRDNDSIMGPVTEVISTPQPSVSEIKKLAEWVAAADRPVIVTSHLGQDDEAFRHLGRLADTFAIPVAENWASCVNIPASHAMSLGEGATDFLAKADVIVIVDSEVPWFPREFSPLPAAKVAHLGLDPLYVRYPIRVFPADLVIPGCSASALLLLGEALEHLGAHKSSKINGQRKVVQHYRNMRQKRAQKELVDARKNINIQGSYVGDCLRETIPPASLIVTELGISASSLALENPHTLIAGSVSGGLGFGLGAALGAKLAAPDRTVIATVGDGSYMFGNPTPFHYVSRAENLPVLTIIMNNSRWYAVEAATRSVYPKGQAVAAKTMPLVELGPSPDFCKVAQASDAFTRRVEKPGDLRQAILDGLKAVANGQQALLDVRTAPGRSREFPVH